MASIRARVNFAVRDGDRSASMPAPHPRLALAVVIPCHDEPDILGTLDSLRACAPPACAVEVHVVVNGSAEDSAEVRARNLRTAAEVRSWAEAHATEERAVWLIEAMELPRKRAGVGAARRLGLDRAAERLRQVGRPDGVLLWLDADCTVAPDYLEQVHAHFEQQPGDAAAVVHFEHPVAALTDPRHRAAITGYELFLRTHAHGLRWAGMPLAIQTVGSTIAVRADAYARAGGMNRRKAGEDFYFLDKLVCAGLVVGEIRSTTVYPSPRRSHRVPFGTGRAISTWLDDPASATMTAYDPRVYDQLRRLGQLVDELYRDPGSLPVHLEILDHQCALHLRAQGVAEAIEELHANTAGAAAFRKRWYVWMSGLRALKLIHHLSDTTYPRVLVADAALGVLERHGLTAPAGVCEEALLERYRQLDRGER